MNDRLAEILLDFLEANIKKMFFGTIAVILIIVIWRLGAKGEAVTLFISLIGYCISQFKFNTPIKTGPAPDEVVPGPLPR